jgi:hypothetical protein
MKKIEILILILVLILLSGCTRTVYVNDYFKKDPYGINQIIVNNRMSCYEVCLKENGDERLRSCLRWCDVLNETPEN